MFGSRSHGRPTGRETDKSWSGEERDHHRFERRLATLNSVIGLFGSFATVAAAIFAYNAYLEAKRQANVAQRALEVSLRPWVYIEKLELVGSISISGDQLNLMVRAKVKNYSQLPANSIELVAEVVAYGSGFSNIHNEVKDFCYKRRNKTFNFGGILPAGDTADTNLSGGSIDLKNSPFVFRDAVGERATKIAIKGCLNYNGPDGAVHQTVVLYQLFDTQKFNIKIQDGLISREQVQFHLSFMYEGDNLN